MPLMLNIITGYDCWVSNYNLETKKKMLLHWKKLSVQVVRMGLKAVNGWPGDCDNLFLEFCLGKSCRTF